MSRNLLRIFLACMILFGLHVFSPAAPVQAGGSGHWASVAPVIDGVAASSEWSGATLLTYTNFQVRYQNDAQFMYFLIDVVGEHPAVPDAISNNEDFVILVDVDQNNAQTVNVDTGYGLTYNAPNPLGIIKNTAINTWSGMVPAISYGKAGFGTSPASATPHRVYEAAIRLSELSVFAGHSLKAGFLVTSTNPSFIEQEPANVYSMQYFALLGMASPRAAFIYNTPAGYSDGMTFQSLLFDNSGIWAEMVDMGQVEMIDFSPYQVIIVGDDTGNSSGSHWLGSAAALAKIRSSGKPVVGIGYGGTGLYSDMGLYINWGNSWLWLSSTGNINSMGFFHPAWNTPNIIPTDNPVAVYSTAVDYRAVDTADTGTPLNTLTRLGKDPNDGTDQRHYTILGQRSNGVCYTLWGFRSQPGLLTTNGRKLFANIVWNPVCMPSVLYLDGGNATLRSGVMTTLLSDAGFYTLYSPASGAASQDFSQFNEIVVGWDTASAWYTPANVNAIRSSHLPVVGMGWGGLSLFLYLGLDLNGGTGLADSRTGATMDDPLQRVMRSPFPVTVDSTLVAGLDSSGGVTEYFFPAALPSRSTTRIGFIADSPAYHSIFTQSYKGVCYSLYGMQSYPSDMTALARSLFRNMAANPICNYPISLPIVRK
jgi:hypothetical protein